MNTHDTLSVVTCVGYLGFALLVSTRRERSPLAHSLLGLFGAAFAYTFADLAFRLSGEPSWHYIDRFCSTFMPVLLLELVSAFVGVRRALGRSLQLCWGASLALAVSSRFFPVWWKLLGAAALAAMVLSLTLLLRHRRQSSDPHERAVTELVFVAALLGTLLGLTDLFRNELSFKLPELGNLGMLIALALIAVAALRLRLLGREVPALFAAYALLAGLLSVAGYLAIVRFFPRSDWALDPVGVERSADRRGCIARGVARAGACRVSECSASLAWAAFPRIWRTTCAIR